MADFEGGTPDSTALYLWLVAKYKSEGLKQAKQDLEQMGQTVVGVGKKGSASISGMGVEIRKGIAPITSMMTAVSRLGLIWAVTIGTGIKLINQASASLTSMRQEATALGMSFQDLQRFKTGIVWADEDVKKVRQTSAAFHDWWREVQNVSTALGIGLSDAFKKLGPLGTLSPLGMLVKSAEGGIKYASDDVISALKKLEEQKNKLQMTDTDYTRWKMENEKRYYTDVLQLDLKMSDEQLKIRKQALIDYRRAEFEALEQSRWNFTSWNRALDKMRLEFKNQTTEMFSSVFIDALDNKLQSSREIFRAFFLDVRNMMIKMLMQQAVGRLFAGLFPATQTTASITSLSSQGAGLIGQGSSIPMGALGTASGGTPRGFFAEGGWAGEHGPQRITVGEKEPELIIPKSQLGRGDTGSNIYYYIQAVDSQSFSDLVARNPSAIVAVTENAIKGNKTLRRTIKNFT